MSRNLPNFLGYYYHHDRGRRYIACILSGDVVISEWANSAARSRIKSSKGLLKDRLKYYVE